MAAGASTSPEPSDETHRDFLRDPVSLPVAGLGSRPSRRVSTSNFTPGLFSDMAPSHESGSANGDAEEAADSAWRDELSQRLATVRQRRQQKQPKFPSLQLPLEGTLASEPALEAPEPATTFPRPVPRMYRAVLEAELAAELAAPVTAHPLEAQSLAEEVANALPVENNFGDAAAIAPRIHFDFSDPAIAAALRTDESTSEAELHITGPEVMNALRLGSESTQLDVPEVKIIAFPKLSPYRPADHELAESFHPQPGLDFVGSALLRIVDADIEPQAVAPLPPAFGGIALGSSPRRDDSATLENSSDRIEVPISAAPLPWRGLAEAVDLLFAAVATTLFGGTGFFTATHSALALGHTITIPTGKFAVILTAAMFVLVWFTYKYVALVFTGSTPGLRLMGLELRQFQGGLADRKHRTRRAWASLLSLLPAGLGYFWCFLDEDFLGWHDRITQTYCAVGGEKPEPFAHGLD